VTSRDCCDVTVCDLQVLPCGLKLLLLVLLELLASDGDVTSPAIPAAPAPAAVDGSDDGEALFDDVKDGL